jgi:hypothetical protein
MMREGDRQGDTNTAKKAENKGCLFSLISEAQEEEILKWRVLYT